MAMQTEETEKVRITLEMIDDFLKELSERGRSPASLKNYRTILIKLYEYLPEDKLLDKDTPSRWRMSLEEQGYYIRTIHTRMSVLNRFLQYLNHREWQQADFHQRLDDVQPKLTRAEYLRLLMAAKAQGKEKVYLLIKTLGGIGVRMQELPQFTIEAIQQQTIVFSYHNSRRILTVPNFYQQELLDYARREGIVSGPIFVTQEKTPLSRSSVWYSINSLSQEAKVSEEKANPRCLWKMYQNTYANIQSEIASLVTQSYEQMLAKEQQMVGWHQGGEK